MTDFYVPAIHGETPRLYKVQIEKQSGDISDFSICGKSAGMGCPGIDSLIQKISSCVRGPLKLSIDLTDIDGNCLEANEISSSTQSICLGLLTAIELEQNNRSLAERWDSIVITGDYDENTASLVEVGQIQEKAESLQNLCYQNPGTRTLLIYVSDTRLPEIEGAEQYKDITFRFFRKGTSITEYWAELFQPQFDETQKRFLREANSFDIQASFVCNEQFRNAKTESQKGEWRGYFIHGEGDSGKTMLAYHLCVYLMSVNAYYAPIWISTSILKGLHELLRQKEEKYNGLTKIICDRLIPGWSKTHGTSQIKESLDRKKYILVIDNLEMQYVGQLTTILKETFSTLSFMPVIITSRYDCDDTDLASVFSIKRMIAGSFSPEEREELVLNCNPDFKDTPQEKQAEFMASISRYANAPGLIASCAKNTGINSIDKTLSSLRTEAGSVLERKERLLKNSFAQLPEETKQVLYAFVKKYYENSFSELAVKDFINDFAQKPLKESLSDLTKFYFIYKTADAEEKYAMKSDVYKCLIFSDFGFAQKEKYIDIFMKFRTAFYYNMGKERVEALIYELRDFFKKKSKMSFLSPYEIAYKLRNRHPKGVNFMHGFLEDATKYDNDLPVIEVLLEEVVHYGGSKSEVINRNAEKNESLLNRAMHYNSNAEVLSFLLKSGGKANDLDEVDATFLHDIYGKIPCFESKCDVFLKYGANINKKNLLNRTPLFESIEWGTKEYMAHLIKRGADVNVKESLGMTPLHIAVKTNDKEKVQLLLQNGADISERDNYGYQPIHFAVHNFDVFYCLVEHDADIHAQTGDGESLLDLVELGPYIDWNPSTSEGYFGRTNLSEELRVRDFLQANKVKRLFHPKNFSCSWLDEKHTFLDYAEKSRVEYPNGTILRIALDTFESLKDFFDIEENLLFRFEGNKTLLHYAVLNSDIRVASYLLKKELGINAPDDDGITPLHLASQYARDAELVQLLLNHGGDKNIVDNNGNSALHYAARNTNEEISEFLLNSGCDKTLRNNDGYLPLGLAIAFNPNYFVGLAFCNKASMEELEICFFHNDQYFNDGKLLFEKNPFCSIASGYFEQIVKNEVNYEKLSEFNLKNRLSNVADRGLKEIISESQSDQKQQEWLDVRLYFSAYNDNPKLSTLWARQGGDLSQQMPDGKTILEQLQTRPDWNYIKRQLERHKIISKSGQIIKPRKDK